MFSRLILILVLFPIFFNCDENPEALGPCDNGYYVHLYGENCGSYMDKIRISHEEHWRIWEIILNTEEECIPVAIRPKNGGDSIEGFVMGPISPCEIGEQP